MNKKGFSLIEMLGSIVIIALLVAITILAYTKYRNNAFKEDLLNLHTTIETDYNNYRKDLVLKGEDVPRTIVIGSESTDFDKYFTSLAYNGSHIKKSSLQGTIINLRTKGEVLKNQKYYSEDAPARAAKLGNGKTANDIFVIDGTCMATSGVDSNSRTVKKECKMNGNTPEPSISDIICIKVKYENNWIIDDFGTEENAISFNKLCKYMVVNND